MATLYKNKKDFSLKHIDFSFILVIPAISMLVLVLVLPLFNVIYLSFCRDTPQGDTIFSGLVNYATLIHDPAFLVVLKNTFIFTFCSVLFHFLLGLSVALLLNRDIGARKVLRTIALIPWMFASVVVAITWTWMYHGQFGVLNFILNRLHIIPSFIPWLSEKRTALAAVIVASSWRGFPILMMMFLAGLQSVPKEQYEAAAVDGATWLQQFRFVTLPNLKPIIAIALALDTIWMFRYFDLVQVMTAGGPGIATEVLVTRIYKVSFEYFKFGEASAVAVITFLILLFFTLVYYRVALEQTR